MSSDETLWEKIWRFVQTAVISKSIPTPNALEENKLTSILKNSLIREQILSDLTLQDMKAASQVNSELCGMVRGSLSFRWKAILVVPKDAVGVEEILANTSLSCDEGVVDLTASLRTVQLLSEKTKELIITTQNKTNFWLRMERLAKLLKHSPALKLNSLYVDIRELEEFSTVVSDLLQVLGVLTNTESLYISDSRPGESDDDHEWDDPSFLNYDTVARMIPSENARSHKLTKFIAAVDSQYSHPVALEVIEEILKRHKETLQSFYCSCITWNLDFMKTMKMPLLEVLAIEVNAADEQVLIGFLEEHENLRELEIIANGKLSKSLLAAIEKQSSKLTRLHILADDFSEVYSEDDWSFLRSMKLLKNFRILVWDTESFEMEIIVMSSLPPNQLSDLKVGGCWSDVGDFELRNALYDLWMSSWNGFQCIRKLTITRCWNSIEDTFMQMILSECKELQELMIQDCPELTIIAGFTGISSESECKGISVKDHQNLKYLGIKRCLQIQPTDLVSTDAFKNLIAFEYIPTGVPPAPIPDDIAVLFILKNPRLETICIPLKSAGSAESIKENVKSFNRPLRRVINRNPLINSS